MEGLPESRQPFWVERVQRMKQTNYEQKTLPRKLIAAFLMLAMLLTLVPASVAYADADYGFQPKVTDRNSLKMIDVCGIKDFTQMEENDDAFINQINGVIDGTQSYSVDAVDDKSGIYFTFTMSAGMNNFSKDSFLKNNMNRIQIYKADEDGKETGDPVAEYSNGNGALQFWGSHLTEELNNHGSYKTDELYIGVEQGVLRTGDYIIVFDKNISGNNTEKKLGKHIKFLFTVKGAPDLAEMITTAEDFLQEVKEQNLIDDSEPEKYPQTAVDTLEAAIAEAIAVRDRGDAPAEEKEQASETLYSALETFKDSINFSIDRIEIAGISDSINVGDTGTVSVKITARPDRPQYKRVSWSAVKYNEGDPESGPTKDAAADNLTISESSGNWVALYSGFVWIKATSLKDPTKYVYKKIEVQAEDGVVAVNIPDEETTVEQQIQKISDATGTSPAEITSLKVFTTGKGELKDADVTYLNHMPSLEKLDLQNAAMSALPNYAFEGNKKLTEVVLPDSLETISAYAFHNCSSLKTIEIPAAVTTIGGSAFAGCTAMDSTLVVHAVYPPDYATSGGSGDSFKGTGNDKPASVTTIRVPYSCEEDYQSKQGWRAFQIKESEPCTLKVEFHEQGTLEQSCQAALESKGLTEEEVTTLKISSPEGVQLSRAEDVDGYLQTHFLYATTLDLSDTEFEDTKCNANTFKGRISLKYIELPESTTNIGGSSFYGCKNLRSIKIPEAVTNIGTGAFGECEMVGSSIIVGPEVPPTYDGQVFPDCVTTMIVPPKSVSAYQKAAGWNTYNIISQVALSLSAESISLEASAKATLTATVTVYNNNVDTVTWTSSNPKVVSVSPERGKTTTVTAEKAGTATITAKAASGYVTAACTVTVRDMAAPGSVKASSPAYNKAKVSWSGVSGAQGYIVYRSTKRSSGYSQVRTLSASARNYTDTGLKTGTTYYYKVRAYKTVSGTRHLGAYSAVVNAKPVLAKAKKVKAKRAGKRKIRVSWKRVAGASGYKVYRSTKKNKGFKAVKTIKKAKTVKYTTKKMKKGKRYYFKVRAYRNVGGKKVYSAYSSRVSCKAR